MDVRAVFKFVEDEKARKIGIFYCHKVFIAKKFIQTVHLQQVQKAEVKTFT
jgi:hypothetical protein